MVATGLGRTAGISLALFAFLCLNANSLAAGQPDIRNLDVRGLEIGGTTTLVIDGDELGKTPRLLLPFPAKQTLKPGSTDKRATFDVTLDDKVEPGYTHLRVATDTGVSLPVVIGIDRLPQRTLATAAQQLPIALHGSATGSTPVETKFTGKAGQKVLVEIEAQRLGSRLRPVIHLYSPKRLQIAWAWASPALFGDARLEATLLEDGQYVVAIHDTEYAGQSPGFFRLKIGQWAYVEQVFPPAISKDHKAVELLASSGTMRVELPSTRSSSSLPLAWPKAGTWSGIRPFVIVSPHPELIEQPSATKGQDLPGGEVGVSGRLTEAFEEDRYRVPVKPRSKVRFEVFAERHGSPLDVALVVRNETGGVLARAEDGQDTLDPVLDYVVPDNVKTIVVGVVDAQGRAGPRGIYRLVVDPQEASTGGADFRLFTPAQRVTIPVGGFAVVPVRVERRGYVGNIELSAEGLPAGVTLGGSATAGRAIIPAGTNGRLVTIRRSSAGGVAAITRWKGRSADGSERPVLLRGHPLERLQPWLATELAIAPTSAKEEFLIDWRGLPDKTGIVPTRKLALPVKVTRPAVNSLVRLTLLTSQLPPMVNRQPDLNRTLRQEKPIELAAKATDGDLAMLVPVELPASAYDVTVQAELLTPDRRTVLATAFTPVRRMEVHVPLVLQLPAPRLEAKLDAKTGATIDIKGKVERREGLASDVALTLTALPPGARANPVTVKAGATDFVVKLILPPNTRTGEFKGLKLVGTGVLDPKQPNVRVRSREVELTLIVQAAGK